jgi:hypothetical protein
VAGRNINFKNWWASYRLDVARKKLGVLIFLYRNTGNADNRNREKIFFGNYLF